MKSLHSDDPPARRPVPEVCGKLLGNGQALLEGSGSGADGVLAAAGRSVGIPGGTFAHAAPAAQSVSAITAGAIQKARLPLLLMPERTYPATGEPTPGDLRQ
jgi:hypothetical protein